MQKGFTPYSADLRETILQQAIPVLARLYIRLQAGFRVSGTDHQL